MLVAPFTVEFGPMSSQSCDAALPRAATNVICIIIRFAALFHDADQISHPHCVGRIRMKKKWQWICRPN
ncbi:hypothetical protein A8H37_08255 [Burkholderia thailandensis]|nr:hypothetical protein A8H37_08255 [Burkholderia thailandensis]